MRVCAQCQTPIPVGQAAIWNLSVQGPCCSIACVQLALRDHPATLTPSVEIFIAQSLSRSMLTPLELRAQGLAVPDPHPVVVGTGWPNSG